MKTPTLPDYYVDMH